MKFSIRRFEAVISPHTVCRAAFDLNALSNAASDLLNQFEKKNGYAPRLYLESGRYIAAPHGVLVVIAINRKDIYRLVRTYGNERRIS